MVTKCIHFRIKMNTYCLCLDLIYGSAKNEKINALAIQHDIRIEYSLTSLQPY